MYLGIIWTICLAVFQRNGESDRLLPKGATHSPHNYESVCQYFCILYFSQYSSMSKFDLLSPTTILWPTLSLGIMITTMNIHYLLPYKLHFFWQSLFEEYFFYYNKLTELHLPKNALVKCCWRSEICKILTDGRMPVKKWIKYISLSSRLKWAKMLAQYIIMYPIKAYKISSCITC